MPATQLGNKSIGSLIKIGVNGTKREFIVAHKGKPSSIYDDSFDGGVILLMKDIYEERQWHASNVKDYANSAIHSYLNAAFLNLIDETIRSQVKQVKIPYRPGAGESSTVNSGASGLACNIFLLSGHEVGSGTSSKVPADGAALDYFSGINAMGASERRIAHLSGSAADWWLRSPYLNSMNGACRVGATGTVSSGSIGGVTGSYGVRPALVLPSSLWVSDDGSAVTSFEGMLATTPASELDCAAATSVEGFIISGSEPSGTARRAVFLVGGSWNKIQAGGALSAVATQSVDSASVLAEGNTAAELVALASVPGFVGERVGVAIAMSAEDPGGPMPAMGLAVKTRSSVAVTEKTELSPVFELGGGARIAALDASASVSGGGTAVVEASVDGGETWGPLASLAGAEADTVQFRAVLTAPTPGASSAKVDRATVQYAPGGAAMSGAGTSELVSVTKDWHIGIRSCRMTVRHAPILHSQMRALASFRDVPQTAIGEQMGTGTGESAAYQLAHASGIRLDSVRLYFDGQRAYSGYEVNTAVGRVTCAAPPGASVTADYEYGWIPEVWSEMAEVSTIPSLDWDETEYAYALPPGEAAKSICAVKIELETTEGRIDGEQIGVGTGALATYRLSRTIKGGAAEPRADGALLPPSAWSLAEDGRSLRIAAPSGAALTADYDWISEPPTVYRFVSAFGE